MASKEEIQYASEMTETVQRPAKGLETFGATVVDYHLVSELLDTVGQIRIRQGRFHVERPQLITPAHYANQFVENFGEEAREYADHFAKSADGMRIIQYGLHFRKEEDNHSVVQGELRAVAEEIAEDVRGRGQAFAGVLIGVDDLWEVSLLRFGIELIGASAPKNIRDLAERGLLSDSGVPPSVNDELEAEFQQAAGDMDRLRSLGNKLRKYGLLEHYEDRFYELVRQARRG